MSSYMDKCNEAEKRIRDAYGHSSLCNCMRVHRGRYLVTRRKCTCGSSVMTREKAFKIVTEELGEMTKDNHARFAARLKELES